MGGQYRHYQRLSAILPGLCCERGWQDRLEVYSLLACWTEVVDAEFAAHSRPGKIVAGVLWLEAENPAWMQQLQYRRRQLLAALNARLRYGRIKDIRLRLRDAETAEPPLEKEVSARFLPPDAAALGAFTQIAAAVKDPACREALLNFWYLSHACRNDADF
ncbi:MAG: DUF721 domain-containing protein [Desulfobulbaceae bacterium]|nr:DUF721 domain-containing protein [Desulfobulbaceae bacterium]